MKSFYFLGVVASFFLPMIVYAQKVAPATITMPPEYQNWAFDLEKNLVQTNLGYLGICVTILLAVGAVAAGIFSILFYFFTYRPFREEIKEYKTALGNQEEKIRQVEICVDKKAEEFISGSKKELAEISNNIGRSSEKQINDLAKKLIFKINKAETRFKAENSRAIALSIRASSERPDTLFVWWLRAAYYYSLSSGGKLEKIAVEAADGALKKIEWNLRTHEFMDEKIGLIKKYFERLKPKYEVKIESMEKIFNEGIFSENKPEATTPLPLK